MRTDAVLGAGFVLMWSSGFVGAVLGTTSAGAWTLLLWRFWVVAALLGGWWLLVRRRTVPARELAMHSVVGVLSQGVYLSGVVWSAELGVPAGIAALVAALQPIAAAVLSGPLLGERTSHRQWLGLLAGLGGVGLVVGGDLGTAGAAPPAAYALPFLAMAGLVAATFVERKTASALPLPDALTIQSCASAVLFTVLAGATGEATVPPDGRFWLAVAWVVVLSTFGGYGFYWLVVRRGSVNRASTLLYLTPPTTMLLGFVMFGEQITARGLLGLAVCAVAVALVLLPPRRSLRPVSHPEAMMVACCSTTSSPPPRDSRQPAPARPRRPYSPNS